MRDLHFEAPMSDQDFVAIENTLRGMPDHVVEAYRAWAETIFLEGKTSGHVCPDCVHQEKNGARAMTLADAELSRR